MIAARRRRAGLLAVLLMLLTLGAVPFAAAVGSPTSAAVETSPEQHTGTEQTSAPAPRLRPAADLTGGAIVPARGHAPALVDLVVIAGGGGRGGEASSSVLRV
ncbi:hypothetical protein Aab01nite_29700 [Paractinoplanes abujensis]|uniref:Phage tail tape-measure protein n=1 Tax=Paractinoplanes abujensis TaxID=882441 RepID=A0A7W7D376_9ACTN|nr:hypothetical protein [Actinoplanes abujensis]MBB4698133.1 phage tail tape-measure protein [Actinoplanes abujensis]GID19380.1 hypothetical protein Aab01nite_29700 [Actinoplanes abujensis]